jgi:hypothetical protein
MPADQTRLTHPAALVRDAQALRTRIQHLQALLALQRDLVTRFEDRLYGTGAADTAARRLMALKGRERG